MQNLKNFNEYLEESFMEEYTGTKDNVEDAYDYWLSNLDIDELIDYADLYAEKKVAEFSKNNLKQ